MDEDGDKPVVEVVTVIDRTGPFYTDPPWRKRMNELPSDPKNKNLPEVSRSS